MTTGTRCFVSIRAVEGVDPGELPERSWIDDLERRAETAASGLDPEWLWWLEREISPIAQK
jgi:hypothetical protein